MSAVTPKGKTSKTHHRTIQAAKNKQSFISLEGPTLKKPVKTSKVNKKKGKIESKIRLLVIQFFLR